MARQKTIRDVVQTTKELRQRAAVHRTLSSYLRTRYLPRDSGTATAQITSDGAPVDQAVILEIVDELEKAAAEAIKASEETLSMELADE